MSNTTLKDIIMDSNVSCNRVKIGINDTFADISKDLANKLMLSIKDNYVGVIYEDNSIKTSAKNIFLSIIYICIDEEERINDEEIVPDLLKFVNNNVKNIEVLKKINLYGYNHFKIIVKSLVFKHDRKDFWDIHYQINTIFYLLDDIFYPSERSYTRTGPKYKLLFEAVKGQSPELYAEMMEVFSDVLDDCPNDSHFKKYISYKIKISPKSLNGLLESMCNVLGINVALDINYQAIVNN